MKPSIPKGTRDFSPSEMVKRNYIFDTIRQVFKLYGYLPIETPSMENMDTLMGKYGEEGDRLIFKILNSGDFLEGMNLSSTLNSKELTKQISEKALRYDLTVPFARYVVMHQNDITFPFKRYQIQPVWRADRPQKGRYREFYQCDADVIGSDSLLNEVELIQIINDVFTKLEIPVIIKLNNRKILQGVAEMVGAPDKMVEIAIAIDKIDKIGIGGVLLELKEKGIDVDNEKVNRLIRELIVGTTIQGLKDSVGYTDFPIIKNGVDEIEKVFTVLENSNLSDVKLQFDISLARGLNYYTGTIIEIKVDTSKCNSQFTSSIGGGGRYDDLTGVFGVKGMSGVGVSFGADRIYDVLEELGKFPAGVTSSTKVMFVNFGENETKHCLALAVELRKAGISTEIYPDAKKLNKQFEYADKRNIPYVIVIGGNEIEKGIVKLRNMISKEEKEMTSAQLIEYFKTI